MRIGKFDVRRFMRVLLILLWTVGACMNMQFSSAAALPEYQIKAVLIYKIAKFIEWPEHAFRDAQTPFNICVLGADPFGNNLDSIRGKQVRGRQLLIQRFNHLSPSPHQCHALFISSSEKKKLGEILGKLGSLPILTISDTKGFAREGTMINFVTKNKKLRFEINLDVSRRVGLKVSSQLLELAIIVSNDRK